MNFPPSPKLFQLFTNSKNGPKIAKNTLQITSFYNKNSSLDFRPENIKKVIIKILSPKNGFNHSFETKMPSAPPHIIKCFAYHCCSLIRWAITLYNFE